MPGAGAVTCAGDALLPDVAAVDPDDAVAAGDDVGVGVAVEFDVGVGVDVGVDVGVEVGAAVVGAGLGVIVLVTQGCGAESGRDAPLVTDPLVLAMVTAVVVMTAPAMHKPVATPATADPCLRTLTRLTPFLRSSVEGSSFTRYRHTTGYLPVVPAADAVSVDLPRGHARRAGTRTPACAAPAPPHLRAL